MKKELPNAIGWDTSPRNRWANRIQDDRLADCAYGWHVDRHYSEDEPESTLYEPTNREWLRVVADDFEAVDSFCRGNGILEAVRMATDIAGKHFPAPEGISIRLSEDPDGEGSVVVIRYFVKCTIEEALSYYDNYITEWISVAKWEVRKRIRLSYIVV
jgi:hypothetical protein